MRAYWFNPRDGQSTLIGEFDKTPKRTFKAPEWGPDWVLVLDDAARNFAAPGTA